MGMGFITFWIFCCIQSVLTFDNNERYVTVATTNGTIMGMRKRVFGKIIYSFLGIPFAKPPIGKLRFRNPEPVENWTNILPTMNYPKACYQDLPDQHELNNPAWRAWINNTEMSEDCLYLSIWTPSLLPKTNTISISTLVWIHGGGFTSGSSTLDMYNGEILASKMNVIVINIQYRLGPFGFLSFNVKDIPGNQGLMDQVIALKWINENLAKFGGDTKFITIFGANSGAVSASFHIFSPLTQKLFNQAILQSGSALSWWSHETSKVAVSKAFHFANISGCHLPKETMENKEFDLYDCLRSLDPVTLVTNQWKMLYERYQEKRKSPVLTGARFYFDIPFKPIIESDYLPKSPFYYLLVNNNGINKKRVMLGSTKNEGLFYLFKGFRSYFMPTDDSIIQPTQFRFGNSKVDPLELLESYIADDQYKDYFVVEAIAYEYQVPTRLFKNVDWKPEDIIDSFDNIVGDFSFKCPLVDFADYYLKIVSKIHIYSFEHQTKYLPLPPWSGVLQGQEIAYIFGKPFDIDFSKKYYNFTDEERELSFNMMTFWSNFAQTGDPNNRMQEYHTKTRDIYWEPYSDKNLEKDNRQHIVMQNKTIYTDRNFRRHQCLFWRSYLPMMKNNLVPNTKCPPRTHYLQETSVKNVKPTIPQRNSHPSDKPVAKSSKGDPDNYPKKQSNFIYRDTPLTTLTMFLILQILYFLS